MFDCEGIARFLNVFMVLIHLCDVNICKAFNEFGNTADDGKNFSSQLGSTDFAVS